MIMKHYVSCSRACFSFLTKTLCYFQLFSSVQFSNSVMSDSLRPHEPEHTRPSCPSPTPRVHPNPRPLSVMPSNHLILCRPLLLLPPVPPNIKVFSNESTLHEVAKVLEFQLLGTKRRSLGPESCLPERDRICAHPAWPIM